MDIPTPNPSDAYKLFVSGMVTTLQQGAVMGVLSNYVSDFILNDSDIKNKIIEIAEQVIGDFGL